MTLSLYRIPFLAPYFVEMQRTSFLNLLDIGLIYELSKRNPISSLNKQFQVVFYPEYYKLSVPKYSPKQAILKSQTYSSRLHIPLQVTNYKTNQRKLQWVLFGNLPLMTKRGHFIINGAPRVIVNQITRSPGIYYHQVYHQGIDQEKIKTYYADLIPYKGAWLRLEIDKKKRVWARMKKTPKIPILTLLQSVGITEYVINQSLPTKHAQFLENSMHETNELENYYHPSGVGQALLAFYLFANPSKNLSDISLEQAKKFLFRKFFNRRTYDLSKFGRAQLNKKFQLSVSDEASVLTAQDLLSAIEYLLKLEHGAGLVDDIDHLKNRRVRASGELIQNQLGTGFGNLEKAIRRKMKNSKSSIFSSINTSYVNVALREFFGSSQLSQFMDQTNPLAELTHKRRISSFGPGGISRETAGMAVRGIHPSHYGRICPIETPEGPNAGLVNSLTVFSRMNSDGFLETPFYNIYQGQTQKYNEIKFFSAAQEEHIIIAPSDIKTNYFNFLPFTTIPVRASGEFKKLFTKKVEYMSVSPLQMISIATSLIPFLEHDDANRALMGSNMQRQAVPLMLPEKPLIGTGLEARVVSDSGHSIQAKTSGFVSYVSNNLITINSFSSNTFQRNSSLYKQKGFFKNKQIVHFDKKKLIKSTNTANLKLVSLENDKIYKNYIPYSFSLLSNLLVQKKENLFSFANIQPKFNLNSFHIITTKPELGSFRTWVGFTNVHFIQPNLQTIQLSLNSYREKFFCLKSFSSLQHDKLELCPSSNGLKNSNLLLFDRLPQSPTWIKNKKNFNKKVKKLINRELYCSKLHFSTLSKNTIQYYVYILSTNNTKNAILNILVKTNLNFSKNLSKLNYRVNPTILLELIRLISNHISLLKASNKHNFLYMSMAWDNINIKKYTKIQENKKSVIFFSKSPYLLQNNLNRLRLKNILRFNTNSTNEISNLGSLQNKTESSISQNIINSKVNCNSHFHKICLFNRIISLYSVSYFQFPPPSFALQSKGGWSGPCFDKKSLFSTYRTTLVNKIKTKKNSINKNLDNKFYFAGGITRSQSNKAALKQKGEIYNRLMNKLSKNSISGLGVSLNGANFSLTSLPKGMFHPKDGLKAQYSLQSYQRSNQNTCVYERPLVYEGDWVEKGEFLADGAASVGGELALGKTILVAYMPWEGYNFEDAILINQRLVFDDVYTSVHIERYETQICDSEHGLEQITAKVPYLSDSERAYLDHNGIVKLGSWVNPGDILVGKIIPIKQKKLSGHEKLLAAILEQKKTPTTKDTSLRVPKNVHGRVVHIEILEPQNISLGMTFQGPGRVHVYIAEKRKIQVGDKMSGRHGNKGIVSKILPRQDMPYLPDGTPIDMVLNPLGVPSRMNVGQIFECLLGLAVTELNEQIKIRCFDEMKGPEASRSLTYSKLFQARLKTKKQWIFNPNTPGKIKLFDGRTGEIFYQTITVGRPYILKLIHLVDEKIHARSTGPYALVTQQPLRGRSKHGGQRVGEMEVWALEGFGAAYTLQEILTNKSDDIKGRYQVMQAILENEPVTLGTPESFKVLLAELQSLCLNIGIYSITSSGIRKKSDMVQLDQF